MNTIWKDKGKGIGKSGDLLLTRCNERRYAERVGKQVIEMLHLELFPDCSGHGTQFGNIFLNKTLHYEKK